jgi:uncharacterized membrane protein (DUF106 family)
MSDDEYYEEEVTSQTSKKGDDAFAKAKVGAKKGELDEQLREYIGEWRKQRAKEEEELKRMKDKQAKRKEIRAEQGSTWTDDIFPFFKNVLAFSIFFPTFLRKQCPSNPAYCMVRSI